MPDQRERSADGHQVMFATHVLAPFVLTSWMSELPARGAPSWVINVSSGRMPGTSLPAGDFQSEEVADRIVRLQRLEREQLIKRPLGEVFEFFARAENLERITPPWLGFQVLTPGPIEMGSGTLIDYRLRLHGLPLRWTSRIELWDEERRFVDQQLRGPYRVWRHLHEFVPVRRNTYMCDRVEYALPFGWVGDRLGLPIVRRHLTRIFDYRRAAVAHLLG